MASTSTAIDGVVRSALRGSARHTLHLRGKAATPLRRIGTSSRAANDRANTQTHPNAQMLQHGKARSINNDVSGLLPVFAAFVGAFAATVGLNYIYNNDPGPSRLLPNRYASFRVLARAQSTSPMEDQRAAQGRAQASSGQEKEHVHLTIEAPSYVAPPKLQKEQVDQLVGAGGQLENVWKIVSIWMKEPSLQIERPYTPLYANALTYPQGAGPIDLLIKQYPDGELGKYAHRLQPDSLVELRGPEMTWQGEKKDELIMIVGGTGITPAYQLLTSILGRPDDELNMLRAAASSPLTPRISILYAAPRPSSFLLVPELASLKAQYGDRINVELVAESCKGDDSNIFKKPSSWRDWLTMRSNDYTLQNLPLKVGILSDRLISDAISSVSISKSDANPFPTISRHILVCGPDGFVAHIAGPKAPQSQGPLGGLLHHLGIPQEEVSKL